MFCTRTRKFFDPAASDGSPLASAVAKAMAPLWAVEEDFRGLGTEPRPASAQNDHALMERSGNATALADIAADLGVSYSTLRRLFRGHTGTSLKRYQTDVRTRRVCELLGNSDKSVKAIASYLGYNPAFHITAQFKNATGLAPSEWRHKNQPDVRGSI